MVGEERKFFQSEMDNDDLDVNDNQNFGPTDAKVPKPEQLMGMITKEANKLYNANQYKAALQLYSNVIEKYPDVAKHYSNRSACYLMLSQYREALEDAKKCLQIDPNFIKAYVRLIKCSLMLGHIVEIETAISKVEQLEPSKQSITKEITDFGVLKRFITEAEVAYNVKDYRKVVYCMDRCCEISPYCAGFKITKAESLAYLGRYTEAENIANGVLYSDKRNVDAIYVRGLCLYYADEIELSFKYFQEVLRLSPDHKKALEMYKQAKLLKQKKEEGNAAFKAERYEQANSLYTEALLVDPLNKKTNAKLHFNKATVAAKLKKFTDSIAESSEALKLDNNYLKAILRRAASHMELQEYKEAIADYERASKIDESRESKRLLLEAKMAFKKSKRKDYYKILSVGNNASMEDIKKAYKKAAMMHHPDRYASASNECIKEKEKLFKDVGEAYSILSNTNKRWLYDNGHDVEEEMNFYWYNVKLLNDNQKLYFENFNLFFRYGYKCFKHSLDVYLKNNTRN